MSHANRIEQKISEMPELSYMIPTEGTYRWRGVECSDGWEALVIETLVAMAELDTKKLLRIVLIKEKFGGLRIHMDGFIDMSKTMYILMHIIIESALLKSASVCETCGESVTATTRKNGGWLITCCDDCFSKITKENV